MNSDIDYYCNLLKSPYDEAIKTLLLKYGKVLDNYYKELSYEKFLRGKIESITKGKYSRTNEGLYCHHIDGRIQANLSSPLDIKENKYPYKHQKKERLVYCDLIEHWILHAIIVRETEDGFGYNAYQSLESTVNDWFINERIPKVIWMIICINRITLSKEEIRVLTNEINKIPYIDKKK